MHWDWATDSRTSKRITLPLTGCWADWSRSPLEQGGGDLALALVGAGIGAEEFASDPARYDLPDSVIGFLRGELGDPAGGWPEPLRTKTLDGRGPARRVPDLSAEDESVLAAPGPKRQAALNRLLFPGPTAEYEAHRDEYGDTSRLSANQFFYGLRHGEEHRVKLEPGVELLIGLGRSPKLTSAACGQ